MVSPNELPPVYLAAGLPPHVRAAIDASCKVVAEDNGRASPDRLAEVLPRVVGALISNQIRITNDLIAANPQMRVLSNFGVGYDNVDIPFATAHGWLVCNTPEVLNEAVADLTFGLILGIMRRVHEAHGFVAGGRWSAGEAFPLGHDLQGKTLGLLGFGRIARAVASRAAPFGLRVAYYDVRRDPEAERAGLAHYIEREELFRSSDIVSVHVFLDETTRKLVGSKEFKLMKPTAYLINTSRGPVVDQAALVEALQQGEIAGAALDVFEREPLAADDPLLTLPNVLLAPHMASGTEETRLAMAALAGRNLIAGVSGQRPEAMVNPEVLDSRG
jgi:lactate dehydrogenase-like 2-hydroxyacid dehydrogenase